MRNRSETIGGLGRSPARQSQPIAPLPPSEPKPPERGLLAQWLHGALFDNVGLKFLSMVLAVTVFLLVNTDKDREITVRVPVKYETPADKVMVSEPLPEVTVTVKGPWRRLHGLDDRELGVMRMDLRDAPNGEVPFTADKLTGQLPPAVEVTSISPRSVRVSFDKRVDKVVEVVAVVTGRPQHGYVVAETKAVPATIKVRGGERLLAALATIRTSDVSLEGRTESFEQLTEPAAPEGVYVDPTQRVGVQVRIVEELVSSKIPSLVVTPRGDGVDPAKWKIEPAQVEVTLTGALLAVEKAKDQMTPIVKLTAKDDKVREVDVTMEGLPPGVGVKISPERVKVTPVKAERP